MYYYLDADDVIIGLGNLKHSAYKSILESDMNLGDINPIGYIYKDGILQKPKDFTDKEEYLKYGKYKQDRSQRIKNIVVTTGSGKKFDGDEDSQHRMLLALQTATLTNRNTTKWKLADNSFETITLDELKEALILSAEKMSEIFLELEKDVNE